ncbi:MAG: DUF2147 domain-containing protein [Proteobacteria bacterium]|nr:DUF2147 domain-containing protein [Pseudomonadota bacterium]
MNLVASRAGVIAIVLALGLCPAIAADPIGTWLTAEGESRIGIAPCEDALCGTILQLRDPIDPRTGRAKTDRNNPDPTRRDQPMLGLQILLPMRPGAKPQTWEGNIYNALNGNIYHGRITLVEANTLKVEGCVLGGLICGSSTWTRVADAPSAKPTPTAKPAPPAPRRP